MFDTEEFTRFKKVVAARSESKDPKALIRAKTQHWRIWIYN